jgi:3-oxoacyl-[acyl-carrier-protein] synthase III
MSFSVIGTGSALPEAIVDNERLCAVVDTSDEWIRTRTGIGERRICAQETVTDIAVKASLAALRRAGVEPSELDLILCATMTGDCLIPSQACLVQAGIGAACPAFDINAACSGFMYALDAADAYFCRGRAKRVLVVAAEAMSRVLNWADRATCVLFGDGAGAVVLAPGDDLLSIRLTARGDAAPLSAQGRQAASPFSGAPAPAAAPLLMMNGREVYRFAVSSVVRDLQDVIADAGLEQGDISWVLLHQANMRILDAAASRLCIPRDRYANNIARYGNTSAASIPVLLDEIYSEGKLNPGDMLALSAFGGGLTTGACVLRWNMPAPADPSVK